MSIESLPYPLDTVLPINQRQIKIKNKEVSLSLASVLEYFKDYEPFLEKKPLLDNQNTFIFQYKKGVVDEILNRYLDQDIVISGKRTYLRPLFEYNQPIDENKNILNSLHGQFTSSEVSLTKTEIKNHFQEYGRIYYISVAKNHFFIDFSTIQAAQLAIKENNQQHFFKSILLTSHNLSSNPESEIKYEPNKIFIYLANFSKVKYQDILTEFKTYGDITCIHYSDNKPTAIVEYKNILDAMNVLNNYQGQHLLHVCLKKKEKGTEEDIVGCPDKYNVPFSLSDFKVRKPDPKF
jgi:hypothetical protein